MSRRSTRAIAALLVALSAAAVLAMTGAPPVGASAPAGGAAPSSLRATAALGAAPALGASAPTWGWVLQLRGAVNRSLTSAQFAAMAAKKGVGASWTDLGGDTWSGIPLWRLVALVDDTSPASFNTTLAKRGYDIQVVGLDGVTATLKSNGATRKWVGNASHALIAVKRNGAPLPFGSLQTDGGDTSWLPGWPARLVGPTLAGSTQPGGVATIIVYRHGVQPPAKPVTHPGWLLRVKGATAVDYTSAQFHALATAHPATWTDTSVTPNVAYAGTPLWRLVALADGGSATTLNLDRLGLHWKDNPGYSDYDGYKVDVYGMGANDAGANTPTMASFSAPAIAGDGKIVIADRADGAPLGPTQGKLVPDGATFDWVPTWPARLAGDDVPAAESFGGALRVVLEPPVVPGYIKPFVLRGRRTVKISFLNFPTPVTWDGTKAGNINPTVRALYRGQTLYRLVGLVDDGNPRTFNVALARKGYKIALIASDGYTWTMSSKTIIGQKHWIVASLKDGAVMSSAEGPYRDVGSFIKPFYGKPSVFKLVQIKLIF